MSHGYCRYGRQYDKEYREKFKSEWFNWETPPPPYLSTDLNRFLSNRDRPKYYSVQEFSLSANDLRKKPKPIKSCYTVPKTYECYDCKNSYRSSRTPTLKGKLLWFGNIY